MGFCDLSVVRSGGSLGFRADRGGVSAGIGFFVVGPGTKQVFLILKLNWYRSCK